MGGVLVHFQHFTDAIQRHRNDVHSRQELIQSSLKHIVDALRLDMPLLSGMGCWRYRWGSHIFECLVFFFGILLCFGCVLGNLRRSRAIV